MPDIFFDLQIDLKFLTKLKEIAAESYNSWKKTMGSLQCQRTEFLSGIHDFMKEEKTSMIILDLASSQ
ncbi:hypothetical protein B7P43_G04857 [Cryptotermes secundus]|uniref:Uncharacterized protein n=1 Tax=Cryptotermes secundus TaxID=105785 RepID=A0A2J7RDZ7_9NEOP|nr:hypothetical protein B7P43_G04857 [Cryptotermes secundus]